MDTKRLVSLFYILYTVYSIVMCGTTDLQLIYLLPALLLIWLCFFLFSSAVGKSEQRLTVAEDNRTAAKCLGLPIAKLKTFYLLIIGILSLLCSIVCAEYYTGLSPSQVIDNILSGESNYISYQIYFKNASISTLSFQKLPYIALMGMNNILYVYSMVFLLSQKNKIKFGQYVYLGLVSVAHLYFGVARGTNYEIYQMFLLLCFCYKERLQAQGRKFKIGVPIALGIAMVLIFFVVLNSRGIEAGYEITATIHYDANGIFSSLFPNFSKYYISLYSYLGFGIYYLATMINRVWFAGIGDIWRGIIPFSNYLYEKTSVNITNNLVVIGVKWVPDAATIMNVVGLGGLLALYYLLGKLLRRVYFDKEIGSNLTIVISYLVAVFCITMPSGHFISFSSEQILVAYTVYRVILRKIKIGRSHEKSMPNYE